MLVARSGLLSRTAPSASAVSVSPKLDALTREMREWGYPWDRSRAARLAADARASRFSFAGITGEFDRADWRGRGAVPLWTYQLHYLEPLEALAWESRSADDALALMRLWHDRARGGVGWDPYPTSVRSAHWSAALLLCGDAFTADQRTFAFGNLHTQLAQLARRLEWHILGNHLLTNLSALSRGALLFAPESVPWLSGTHALYQQQLAAQFPADGLHEERTPMYHAIALRAALEEALLRRASGAIVAPDELERLGRMLRADAVMRRPDGAIRLLNDSVESETPSRAYLEKLGTRLLGTVPAVEFGRIRLRTSGYAGFSGKDASCIVDAGAPAPPWQPGHAHCGALSFELEIHGRPLVIDSGLSGYDGDPLREYVRSTRAHSTVSIGGREQGEVWGTFRMARRWAVREATVIDDSQSLFAFRAAISPYWSARVLHKRELRLSNNAFSVNDLIAGAAGEHAESFVHLAPDLTPVVNGLSVSVRSADAEVARITFTGVDRLSVVRGEQNPAQGWHCPDFGVRTPAAVLIARVDRLDTSHRCGFTIEWQ
jgi:hypothetical protein